MYRCIGGAGPGSFPALTAKSVSAPATRVSGPVHSCGHARDSRVRGARLDQRVHVHSCYGHAVPTHRYQVSSTTFVINLLGTFNPVKIKKKVVKL
jgi:hypothetical protein